MPPAGTMVFAPYQSVSRQMPTARAPPRIQTSGGAFAALSADTPQPSPMPSPYLNAAPSPMASPFRGPVGGMMMSPMMSPMLQPSSAGGQPQLGRVHTAPLMRSGPQPMQIVRSVTSTPKVASSCGSLQGFPDKRDSTSSNQDFAPSPSPSGTRSRILSVDIGAANNAAGQPMPAASPIFTAGPSPLLAAISASSPSGSGVFTAPSAGGYPMQLATLPAGATLQLSELPPPCCPSPMGGMASPKWTAVPGRKVRQVGTKSQPTLGFSQEPPSITLEKAAVEGAEGDGWNELYYERKELFNRSWTRESKQARSVKDRKRVNYQIEKRRNQSIRDRGWDVESDEGEPVDPASLRR